MAVAIAVAVIVAKHGSSSAKVSTDRSTPPLSQTARAGTAGTSAQEAAVRRTVAPNAVAGKPVPGVPGTGGVPLEVRASGAHGLHDGDAVSIHVAPASGSVVYGFEARLCRGGTTYDNDADMRPTLTGNCVSRPLSSASDDYLAVRTQPPYSSADGSFRVGVGTDTFQLRDGRAATVTCGPGNPCTIVLELQYPNGYGFETIPVTYR